jgi:hypothetical protein
VKKTRYSSRFPGLLKARRLIRDRLVRPQSKDVKTIGCNGNGMLPLGRQFFIAGDHRPAIFGFDPAVPWFTIGSMVNTILFQHRAFTRFAVVQHLRIFVHLFTHTVSAILRTTL